MAPKANSVLSRLPVIGQYQEDKATREAQDSYFATLESNSGYLEPEPTVLGYIKRAKPTRQGVFNYIADTFPCSKWICNYNLQWLIGDLVAGVTVGAVVIPQGMAYAKLAQLPVQYGLYTSFIGSLCYWIFGTSKDIAIGPVAVASIVTAQIVADLSAEHPMDHLQAPMLAGIVAMLSGAVVALVGVLRLGWLVDLIALPAVSSFITGSALTITFGQIPPLLGMRKINSRDPAIKIGINILKHLDRIRIDAAFGLTALVLLYAIKWTCSSVAKRRPKMAKTIFFISTLRTVLTIILYTLISFILNRNRKQDPMIRILGFIPRGFQSAQMPHVDAELMKSMISQIPAAAIVLVIEHISIGKEFGRINNYTINPNSEFIAIGVVNVLGPMVGAYAATGSFSRTAINSKAGSRTPMSGVVTALVVVIALYTMTSIFFFVPTSALAAVIIHAIGDLVTPPSTLYEFWKISPLDVLIFIVGLAITLSNSIEHGVFAMIALSLAVLLFRVFQAHGSFLGRVQIRTMASTPSNGGDPTMEKDSSSLKLSDIKLMENVSDEGRSIFLPLDRKDGSNPKIQLEVPYPGVFIYRLKQGLNYANSATQLDDLVEVITHSTQRGKPLTFDKPGDRPWNVPRVLHVEDALPDTRPKLQAIILDFSSVDNVDLTAVQYLIDVRNLLDRHAAPHSVQWHFASVYNPWSKRALAAAGFGYPSFETADGRPQHFKPIYSLAEMAEADPEQQREQQAEEMTRQETRRSAMAQDVEGGEVGGFTTQQEKVMVEKLEVSKDGKITKDQMSKMAAIHGINRPFFHPDVQSALTSAVATLVVMEATMEMSPEEKERREREKED